MSKLTDLLEAVKEKNLTKSQLESYRDDMTSLYSDFHLEMAQLEKDEAIYFLLKKSEDKDAPDVSIKRMWNGSTNGQRLIELRHYSKATEKMLSSLKSRIFAQY